MTAALVSAASIVELDGRTRVEVGAFEGGYAQVYRATVASC